MNITYIEHSGFLAETADCYYLFDYYKGSLPTLKQDKPILVFSSHGHIDHYNPDIFSMLKENGMQHITAILSKDIPAGKYPVAFPDIPCFTVTFHEVYELPCKTTVETLFSTDEGVAFLLRCPEGMPQRNIADRCSLCDSGSQTGEVLCGRNDVLFEHHSGENGLSHALLGTTGNYRQVFGGISKVYQYGNAIIQDIIRGGKPYEFQNDPRKL